MHAAARVRRRAAANAAARRVAAAVAAWLALGAVLAACASAESAAARDPMRCERDPSCARGRSRYADCTRQCADNPECIDRCEQVQQQMDSLGHRQ